MTTAMGADTVALLSTPVARAVRPTVELLYALVISTKCPLRFAGLRVRC